MSDIFYCAQQGGSLQRQIRTRAVILGGSGDHTLLHDINIPEPYASQPIRWGGSLAEALPLSYAIVSHCLTGNYGYDASQIGSDLHDEFAAYFICTMDFQRAMSLEWFRVQSWFDYRLTKVGRCLAGAISRVRELEYLLTAALRERGNDSSFHSVNPAIWARWNLEDLISICHLKQSMKLVDLYNFVDHLMDLKFKLYCLLEVDIPLYADGINRWGLDEGNLQSTPQGFACRLSEEVTIIVKSRAIWESVMNVVYSYVGGPKPVAMKVEDGQGGWRRSEKERFFSWVDGRPEWSSLKTFKPIVEALDNLRTPEVHELSRTRGNFTNQVLIPISQCLELLKRILTYFSEHLITVIALGGTTTYDASAESPQITIS